MERMRTENNLLTDQADQARSKHPHPGPSGTLTHSGRVARSLAACADTSSPTGRDGLAIPAGRRTRVCSRTAQPASRSPSALSGPFWSGWEPHPGRARPSDGREGGREGEGAINAVSTLGARENDSERAQITAGEQRSLLSFAEAAYKAVVFIHPTRVPAS